MVLPRVGRQNSNFGMARRLWRLRLKPSLRFRDLVSERFHLDLCFLEAQLYRDQML